MWLNIRAHTWDKQHFSDCLLFHSAYIGEISLKYRWVSREPPLLNSHSNRPPSPWARAKYIFLCASQQTFRGRSCSSVKWNLEYTFFFLNFPTNCEALSMTTWTWDRKLMMKKHCRCTQQCAKWARRRLDGKRKSLEFIKSHVAVNTSLVEK